MANLAIQGGTPIFPEGIRKYFTWPIYDDAERRGLLEVLESGRWCSRDFPDGKVAEAERVFAKLIGTKHAQAVNTGTTAIEMALRACQVGIGDEVLVPAATFIASASAPAMMGAVPVYVDIDPETYQISPEAAEAAITERTRAILPVHYGGYPADMDRIGELAKKHDLAVIEDCAEAYGTRWRGKQVGSLGDVGCFSFQMGKPLTCGEGGAMTFDRDELAVRCYTFQRSSGDDSYWLPAGNFRMSEFSGAILLAQMARIERQTHDIHENAEYLSRELEKIEGLAPLKRDERITRMGYFFYFMRYDPAAWGGVHRDRFVEALLAEGLFCSTAHNQPLYLNPEWRWKSLVPGGGPPQEPPHCPEAERIFTSEVVSLGKGVLQNRPLVEKALSAIHKLRDNVDELKREPVQRPAAAPAPPPPARKSGLKSLLKRVTGR